MSVSNINKGSAQVTTMEDDRPLTIQEQRDILRKEGFETILPVTELSENQKRIQEIFKKSEKDQFGRAIIKLKQIEELEKIQEVHNALEKAAIDDMYSPVPTHKAVDAVVEQTIDKIVGKDAFTTEGETLKLYNILNSQEGRDLLKQVGKIGRDAFSGALQGLQGSKLTPTKRVATAPGDGDRGKRTQEEEAIDKQFNRQLLRLQAVQKPLLTDKIDTAQVYSNSQLQRVYKQAILKSDLDQGSMYGSASRQNRLIEDKKRIDVNRRLEPIKTKGQRIILPMNSASFDMMVGYP